MQPRLLHEPLRLASAPLLRLQSDERLVRLVRAGSHPAFTELVHRYRPALVRYTSRLVGADRAEDVVQQGLANAHTALMADERTIDVKPWLYRIVHNAALNVLRGARDVLTLDDHESELALPGVDAQVEQRERFRSVISAVQALPTAQRDALLLRELEGRSHEEIAAALGVTAGAARQHLMRARATMRAAVTAVTPYPLVLKLAALGAGAGASSLPAAEAVTGAGVGLTLSKLGAGALAAGALAGGAGVVAITPEPRSERAQGTERIRPAGSPAGGARVSSAPPAPGAVPASRRLPAATWNIGGVSRENDDAERSARRKDASRERGNHPGRKAAGRDDHRGRGATSSGRDEDDREESSSAGDDHADDDRHARESAARGRSSGSHTTGSGSADFDSGSGSGSSGSSGSDSSGSGSGSGSSGSAGSDSSGSGSRDDGEDRIDDSDDDAPPGTPIPGAAAHG